MYVSKPKMDDYKTTQLLVSGASDWNGLAHSDSRDLDWFGPEMPYVQYVGWFSHSIARAQVLKVARGAYKPSSSEGMIRSLAYMSGIPLLCFKVGPPYLLISIASVCCSFAGEDSLFL